MVRYNIKSGKSVHEKHILSNIEGVYYYDHIFEDSKGTIWVGGRCIPAQKVTNYSPLKIKEVPNKTTIDYHAACYAELKDGTVLCFDGSGKCYKYHKSDNVLLFDHQTPISTKCAVRDRYGNIWIGGGGGIANIIEKKQYLPGNNAATSLLSDDIMCLYPDNEGNIWIGTDKGVSLLSASKNAVKNYVHLNKEGGIVPITSLMQDSDNLLWIGTENDGVDTLNINTGAVGNIKYSLLRENLDAATIAKERYTLMQYKLHNFDGSRYKYHNENRVSTLYQDTKGKIYIGLWSHVGFNVYDKKTKSIKRYALWSEAPTMSLPNLFRGNLFGANWYAGFLEDSMGNFWCATWESIGLNLFDRDKGSFTGRNFINKKIPLSTIGGSITKFIDKKRNRIYFTIGRSYFYYDIAKNRFIRYANTFPASYPNREIYEKYYQDIPHIPLNIPPRTRDMKLTPYSQDTILLTSQSDIMIHDLNKDKIVKIIKTDNQYSNYVLIGRDKTIGYNFSSSNIYRVDLKKGTYRKLSDYCKKAVLPEKDRTFSQYINPNGTLLYIGSSNELYLYDTEKNLFFKANIQGYSGGNIIFDITEDDKGYIYLSTNNGISIIDKLNEQHHLLNGVVVKRIIFNKKRNLIACTNEGLFILDSNYHIIKRYSHNPLSSTSTSTNAIVDITEIINDKYFVCGDIDEFVQLFDLQSGKFSNFSDKDEYGLSTRLASCIIEDNHKNIWYGSTEDGVNIINLKSGKVRHYRYCSWDKNSLPDNNINCMKMDSGKNIWIGTCSGLYLVKNKDIPSFNNIPNTMEILLKESDKEAYYKFNTESIGKRITEFSSKNIMGIEEDSKGRLWITTSSGIFCYNVEENIIISLPQRMGFSSNNWVKNSSAKLSNGSLIFGNDKSADLFSPDFLLAQIHFPQILLSNFKCKEKILYPDISSIPTEIKLKYTENSISFLFSSTDYINSRTTKFRYRIKGYEEQWNYPSTADSRATYTKIAAGKYRIEIECTNNAGQWPDEVINLQSKKAEEIMAKGINEGRYSVLLIISPPFYMSWYFVILCIIILITLIWIIIKVRERKILREKKELELIVEQRTSDLKQEVDSKNKFFSIISHDLKNPISSLRYTSEYLYDKYMVMSEIERIEYMEVIKSASESTFDILNSILMWVLSQRGMIKANIRECNLHNLVTQTKDNIRPEIIKKKINLINDVPEEYIIQSDSDLLTIIVRNLISNAIKFTPEKGKIIVGTVIKDEKEVLYIKDNGIGMTKEIREKLFRIDTKISTHGTKGESGSGFGLIMSNELAIKLGYTIEVESTPGKGSTFFIFMPAQDIPTH